jgi:hypothetical protein
MSGQNLLETRTTKKLRNEFWPNILNKSIIFDGSSVPLHKRFKDYFGFFFRIKAVFQCWLYVQENTAETEEHQSIREFLIPDLKSMLTGSHPAPTSLHKRDRKIVSITLTIIIVRKIRRKSWRYRVTIYVVLL